MCIDFVKECEVMCVDSFWIYLQIAVEMLVLGQQLKIFWPGEEWRLQKQRTRIYKKFFQKYDRP
jgi:hypothetical protein